MCLTCLGRTELLGFCSAKAGCLAPFTAGPWGLWHKAPSLWLEQLLQTFKADKVSRREPVGDVMTVNVSSLKFYFQNPGNFSDTKEYLCGRTPFMGSSANPPFLSK